jgi:oligopeptide/dipeptide ABC transporter ATP-binding protein
MGAPSSSVDTQASSGELPTGAGDLLLSIEDLQVHFFTDEGVARAVDGVNLSVRRGSFLAIVGESGCGKTVTAYSILRLIQEPGRIVGGRIELFPKDGTRVDVTELDDHSEELYKIRGGTASMIFQEPMTALSPVHTIGDQICEAILLHQEVTVEEATARAVDMLSKVGIPSPETRIDLYPHELSGGMRQRTVIAMALACNPELLIADEPTTALDVTIQAQILQLLKNLQSELQTSVLLITHDLGVVAQTAEEVAVMYLGRVVEQADVRTIMKSPRHPYTIALLQSLPGTHTGREQRLASIAGSVPSVTRIPAGCAFHPRCPHAKVGVCDTGESPKLEKLKSGHVAACFRLDEIPLESAAGGTG